jgi:hypothetical protein
LVRWWSGGHGGHMVVIWWSYGGHMVVRWWSGGGQVVVRCWSGGGEVVVRWCCYTTNFSLRYFINLLPTPLPFPAPRPPRCSFFPSGRNLTCSSENRSLGDPESVELLWVRLRPPWAALGAASVGPIWVKSQVLGMPHATGHNFLGTGRNRAYNSGKCSLGCDQDVEPPWVRLRPLWERLGSASVTPPGQIRVGCNRLVGTQPHPITFSTLVAIECTIAKTEAWDVPNTLLCCGTIATRFGAARPCLRNSGRRVCAMAPAPYRTVQESP